MYQHVILSVIYLIYLVASFYVAKKAITIKSPLNASLLIVIYLVFTYICFELLKYAHNFMVNSIDDLRAFRNEGLSLLLTFIVCLVTALFVTLFVVVKRFNKTAYNRPV
jgi:hypothetical protein